MSVFDWGWKSFHLVHTEDLKREREMVFCYQNCTVGKNCSSDREKLLKFEAEGREFAKILRSQEQSNSERSENFLVYRKLFYLVHGGFLDQID